MTGWSGFVTVTFTIISFFLSRNATTANFFFAGRRIIRCRGVATAIADRIDACEGGGFMALANQNIGATRDMICRAFEHLGVCVDG